MMKFLVKNMGCKSNQLEGALIEENLIKNGFEKVDKTIDADFFILNSCTVTHKSDKEALYILQRAKHDNPSVKTVLTGCIAQIEKEKLLENDNVDIVLGNDEKLEISKYINPSPQPFLAITPLLNPPPQGGRKNDKEKFQWGEGDSLRSECEISEKKCSVSEIGELSSFHEIFLLDTKKTRASLKIQDGCDNRCSYCIIPFARGKSRSADVNFILDQIKIYEQAGFKEIVLTGIHIGQWGKDSEQNKENLLHLLRQIEEKTDVERYRLGSLNPLEFDDELLNFLKNSNKFCPHFHLSLQSMCDKTLKSMNRHYSVQEALDLIEKIAKMFPLAFIGSDVIAGFVGESEEDFQITVDNLKKSKLTQIHTFPYSIRKGTVAEKLDGHLPQKTKDNRASVIKQISAQKYEEFLKKNVGSVQEVLVEKNLDKKTGFYKGVTRNYINVLIGPNTALVDIKNTLQKVEILSVDDKILAKIIN